MTVRLRIASLALAAILMGAVWAGPSPGATGPEALTLSGPQLRATWVAFRVFGAGAPAEAPVAIERRLEGVWQVIASTRSDAQGRFQARVRPRGRGRIVDLRARVEAPESPTALSEILRVRTREVRLAAVGDINLGDGVGSLIRSRGPRYPWTGVARPLRRADIAFGNLECAISRRGSPVPKQFNFRGTPKSLRVAGRFAGLDVLNLANNHSGDFGARAMLDTISNVRRFGMVPVGAGNNRKSASRPRVVERLGLRVGFVGYSQILPASFFAGKRRPGTVFASPGAVRAGVRAARRRADVVIATFHWGEERAGRPSGLQRALASVALRAGADAVIGAHPHVLQPIRRRRHRVVAYSLGNFVFIASSGATSRTGILNLRLSTRGVERARLRPARIVAGRPRLR